VSLPVGKFLQKPTIVSLAGTISEVLDTTRADKKEGSASAKEAGNVRLPSPRQEWLWPRIPEDGPLPMHRLMELIYAGKVKAPIDLERLNQAFRNAVTNHEMLRSAFPELAGKPSVTILPTDRFTVRGIDATTMDEASFMSELRHLANTPHDLEHGPLIDLR